MKTDLPTDSADERDQPRKKLEEYPLPDEFQAYDDRKKVTLFWLVLLVVILVVVIVVFGKII